MTNPSAPTTKFAPGIKSFAALLASAVLAASGPLHAGAPESRDVSKEPAPASKPAPLPLHEIEGTGGILVTQSAYIVNPPRNGEPVGRPAIGSGFVSLGHGQVLVPATLTWSPFDRLELGYGLDFFSFGDFTSAVRNATGISLSQTAVWLSNFNARFQLLKENEFNQKWLPALTFGVDYKVNAGISQVNKELNGTLTTLGIPGNQGVDFTLYASKLLTFLPRPVLINAGGRATRGQELGLLGFSNNYSFLFEGNVAIFLTDWLILAGEYRQQPNDYTAIPGLVSKSGDWWTVDLAWVVSKNFTIAGGYGYFGNVLNHNANGVWGFTLKYEF